MTWTAAQYFAKAQSYWRRATALSRTSPEFMLYLTFTCEFMIRGGLTAVNPVLNASLDVDSIVFAAGLPTKRPPRTVDIAEGLDRLARIIPTLSAAEILIIKTLMDTRNRELHGDMDEISNVATLDVVPNVLALFVKIAGVANEDLSVLMGAEDAQHAIEAEVALSKDRRERVGGWIRTHKDRFFQLSDAEQKDKRESVKRTPAYVVLVGGLHAKATKCPSCAQLGLLVGRASGRSSPILGATEITIEMRITPIQYNCKCCDLTIKGLDELIAAKFPHEFYMTETVDPLEHFSIDPMDYVDVDEVIREHFQHEYQDE